MHTYNPKLGGYGCQTCRGDLESHVMQSYAAIAALREMLRQPPILDATSETEHKGWRIKPLPYESDNARWCSKALLRTVDGGILHVQIMPNRLFNTRQDANACAVEMAKDLIDNHGYGLT